MNNENFQKLTTILNLLDKYKKYLNSASQYSQVKPTFDSSVEKQNSDFITSKKSSFFLQAQASLLSAFGDKDDFQNAFSGHLTRRQSLWRRQCTLNFNEKKLGISCPELPDITLLREQIEAEKSDENKDISLSSLLSIKTSKSEDDIQNLVKTMKYDDSKQGSMLCFRTNSNLSNILFKEEEVNYDLDEESSDTEIPIETFIDFQEMNDEEIQEYLTPCVLGQLFDRILEYLKCDLKDLIDKLRNQNIHLKQEIESLKIKLNAAVESNDEQVLELKEMTDKISDFEIEIRELSRQLEALESKLRQYQNAEREISGLAEVKTRLVHENKALVNKVTNLKQILSTQDVKEDINDFNKEIESLKEMLMQKEEELKAVYKTLDDKDIKLNAIVSKQDANEFLHTTNSCIHKSQHELGKQDGMNEEDETNFFGFAPNPRFFQEIRRASSLHSLAVELGYKEDDVNKLKEEEAGSLKTELDLSIYENSLDKELLKASKQLNKANDEINKLTDVNNCMVLKVEELEKNLLHAKNELDFMTKSLEESNEKLKVNENDLVNAKSRIVDLENDVVELEELKEKIIVVLLQLEEKNEENVNALNEISELKELSEKKSLDLVEVSKKLLEVEDLLHTKCVLNDKLINTIKNLEEEIQKNSKEINNYRSIVESQKLESLEKTDLLNLVVKEFNLTKKQLKETQNALGNVNQNLKNNLDMKYEIESLSNDLDALKTKLDTTNELKKKIENENNINLEKLKEIILENEELQAENCNLCKKIDSYDCFFKKILKESNEKENIKACFNELNEQLMKIDDENNSLKRQVKDLLNKTKDLSTYSKKEVDELLLNLEELKKENELLLKKKEVLEKQNEDNLRYWQSNIKSLKMDSKKENNIIELNDQIQILQRKIQSLEEKNLEFDLKNENMKLNEKLNNIKVINVENEKRINDRDEKIKFLKKIINSLKADLNNDNNHFQSALDDDTTIFNNLTDERKILNENIKNLQAEMIENNDLIESLKDKINILEHTIDLIKSDEKKDNDKDAYLSSKDTIINSLQNVLSIFEKVNKSNERIILDLNEQINKINEKIVIMQKEEEESIKKIRYLEQMKIELEEVIEYKEKEIIDLINKNNKLQDEIKSLNKNEEIIINNSFDNEKQDMSEIIEKLKKEQAKVKELENQKIEYTNKINQLNEETMLFKDKIHFLETDKNGLVLRVEKLQEATSAAMEKIKLLQEEKEECLLMISLNKKQVNTLQDMTQDKDSLIGMQSKDIIDALQNTIDNLEKQNLNQIERMNSLIHEKEKLAEKLNFLMILEEKPEHVQERINLLIDSKFELEKRLNSFTKKIDIYEQMQTEHESLQTKVLSMALENATLEQRKITLETDYKKLLLQKQKVEKENSSIQEKLGTTLNCNYKLQEELKQMKLENQRILKMSASFPINVSSSPQSFPMFDYNVAQKINYLYAEFAKLSSDIAVIRNFTENHQKKVTADSNGLKTNMFNVGFPQNVIPMINVYGPKNNPSINISGMYDARFDNANKEKLLVNSKSILNSRKSFCETFSNCFNFKTTNNNKLSCLASCYDKPKKSQSLSTLPKFLRENIFAKNKPKYLRSNTTNLVVESEYVTPRINKERYIQNGLVVKSTDVGSNRISPFLSPRYFIPLSVENR